jgi:hypothetical protein
MRSKQSGTWPLLLGIGLALGGCATTQVSADYDPGARFGTYRTFELREGKVFRQGMPDPGDTLVRDRVNAALAAEMTE